jgi:hypothetical protein
MLAKPDRDRVLATAGFSMRADMQKANRLQMLKKESRKEREGPLPPSLTLFPTTGKLGDSHQQNWPIM